MAMKVIEARTHIHGFKSLVFLNVFSKLHQAVGIKVSFPLLLRKELNIWSFGCVHYIFYSAPHPFPETAVL